MGNAKQSNEYRQHDIFSGESNRRVLMTLYSMFIGFTSLVFTPNTGAAEPSARIGVRPGTTTGEFYSVKEGSKQLFKPCGNSWVILQEEADGDKHHANFSPEVYSSFKTERVLTKMEQSGYNVVRVFIFKGHFRCAELTSVGGGSRDSTGELNKAYMINFIDFLKRARNHNLYVQVVLDGWPWPTYVTSKGTTGKT